MEEFLNNCFIVKTVSLKDVSWELLLQKINDRFVTVAYIMREQNYTIPKYCIEVMFVLL